MARRLTYLQARILLLMLGLLVAGGQAYLAWERGAPPTEVLAPVLYIPVFVGAILWFLPGGLLAAALASAIYSVLLVDQSAVVGVGAFLPLLLMRVGTYFVFAVLFALGVRSIERRLRKLEVYDLVDDLTGLNNSSFFLQDTDLEAGRSNRYRTIFSVAELAVSRPAFEGMPQRRHNRIIRELGHRIRDAVRQVDRAVHLDDGERDRFLVILPETGPDGARIFADRLQEASSTFLEDSGCHVNGFVAGAALTYPDEPDSLTRMREEVALVEARRRAVSDEG